MGNPIGLYFHIPFCRGGKCPYCDFYSLPYEEDLADRTADALKRAMESHPYGALAVDTVYFGGGTPLLMGERLIGLLEAVHRRFALTSDAEITLEANPEGADAGLLEALCQSGFNRISFGVQSASEAELAALGRRHGVGQSAAAIEAAWKAGFRRISADLMLATPHQTIPSLRESVDFLASLPLDHISAYLLKVEDGTPFAEGPSAALCPGEDAAADLYLEAVRRLWERGFAQYEVSNFARAGGASRHNLKYWRCEEYLGLGPAAHSYLAGRRFYFPPDLRAFLDSEAPFALSVDDGAGGGFEEYAMLRLRLREGLDLGACERRFGVPAALLKERAASLEPRGLLTLRGDVIRLTPQGFLLLGPVTAHLLSDGP